MKVESEREAGEGEDKPGSPREEHQQSPTAVKGLPPATFKDVYLPFINTFQDQEPNDGDSREQPPMGEPTYLAPADIKRLRSASSTSTSSSGSDSSQVRDSNENRIVENSFDHPKEEQVWCSKQAIPNSSMPVLIGFCVC